MALIPFSTGDTDSNLGFVERVKAIVFPDLEEENLIFPHARFVQNALITAQTYVECLRNNNVNFYDKDDVTIGCNVASFDGPSKSRIQAVYAFKPCGQCQRHHYDQKSPAAIMCYVDEYSGCHCRTEGDICNAILSGEQYCDQALGASEHTFQCSDRFFAKGSNGKLYLAPSFPCDYKIAVHWEGIKYLYESADLIADDEDLIDLVSVYLHGERALRFDRDIQLYKELMRRPERKEDMGGLFWQKLAAMNHRCREERRLRKLNVCDAIFDDMALASMIPQAEVDQTECDFEEPVVCEEGQYVLDGVCVDCEDPVVTLTADFTSIIVGSPVTLSWTNTVPALDSSIVTLEYGETITTLANNSSGTLVVSPTESTTYLIRAITTCGNVVASVGIAVAAEPCLCPDGLPDCLEVDLVDPLDFTQCNADAYDECDEQDAWDGTIPRISECVWDTGFGAENGAGAVSVNFSGPVCRAFRARVELISCDPLVYEMTFSSRFEGEELIFWKGRSTNSPFGTYVSQDYGVGQLDNYCYAEVDFDVIGCFDAPCTPPTIRFDPPAGSTVNFPTLVFIHSTNDSDIITYSLDGGTTFLPYTEPVSMTEGQTLSAQSFTLSGCVGAITQASYASDGESLVFDFICDEVDKAGVFGVFSPNGDNDYHWRIKITRPIDWQFIRATIYETNASGVWVTGQAWATVNPIFPVEMSPDPFAVYPLVLFDGTTQLNSAYGEPVVANVPAGEYVVHGYGQPFVALTGYFRLELKMNEGAADFTIYKLIPHTCIECPTIAAPTVSIDCDGVVTFEGAVPAGSTYKIRRAQLPDCGTGVFEDVLDGVSVSGAVSFTETVTTCCNYSYILSAYCVESEEFVDSAAVQVTAPCDDVCSCDAADCAALDDVYYLGSTSLAGIQIAVQECTVFGDCDAVILPGDSTPTGCTGTCPGWDQSYARADALCVWNAPENKTYDGQYAVNSRITRVVDGEDCYWQVKFWCDANNPAEYRKSSGETPSGVYTLFTDPCSAETNFPGTIEIGSTIPG